MATNHVEGYARPTPQWARKWYVMNREQLAEIATTFYVAAPEGAPWGLESAQFAAAPRQLSSASLTAPLTIPQEMARQTEDSQSLMFAVPIEEMGIDGQFRESTQSLNIGPSTAAEAAVFIEWLQTLLPRGARMRFNSEEGVESGDMSDYWLPADGARDSIAEALLQHLEEVVDE